MNKKKFVFVGMIKTWRIVTLESLVNHVIAENISNRDDAITAIEFPYKVIKEFRSYKKAKSELSKKLGIINNGFEDILSYISIADELSNIRNCIVHDKPTEFTQLEEGEFEIEEIRKRGLDTEIQLRFSSLNDFYSKCDKIREFIISKVVIEFNYNMSFSKLMG